jgi:hypothetical protein
VLASIILNGPEEVKVLVLQSLEKSLRIQSSIVTKVTPLLGEDQPGRLKIAVYAILQRCYGHLPEDTFRMVAAGLEDRDGYVRRASR